MKITHIDHVNIVVRDLPGAIDFFQKLGLKLDAQKKLEGAWVNNVVGLEDVKAEFAAMTFEDGQTVIELLKYMQPEGDSDTKLSLANQIGYRHIAFSVTDIEAWHTKLRNSGIECLSDVQTVPNYKNKKMFYFKGPEGIILELMEYPDMLKA